MYTSTNGDEWFKNTGWEGTSPCSSYGISCSGGSVQILRLFGNQLNGSIPQEIGNLVNLEALILEWNHLIGSIPQDIGKLTNLKYLEMGGNELSGFIPPEIGNLTNLGRLYLRYNQLCGEVPFSMTNLIHLNNDIGLFIQHNYLHTNNSLLNEFLILKGGYWAFSQRQIVRHGIPVKCFRLQSTSFC